MPRANSDAPLFVVTLDWDGAPVRQSFGACNVVCDGLAKVQVSGTGIVREFRVNLTATRGARNPEITLRYMTAAKRGHVVPDNALGDVRTAVIAAAVEHLSAMRAAWVAECRARDAVPTHCSKCESTRDVQADGVCTSCARPVVAPLPLSRPAVSSERLVCTCEPATAICGNCERPLADCSVDPCTMIYPVCRKCMHNLPPVIAANFAKQAELIRQHNAVSVHRDNVEYRAGCKARCDGLTLADCPYLGNGERRARWNLGWNETAPQEKPYTVDDIAAFIGAALRANPSDIILVDLEKVLHRHML